MLAGLRDEGKNCLLLNWEDTGLFNSVVVLEMSRLMPELFSLPLLHEI